MSGAAQELATAVVSSGARCHDMEFVGAHAQGGGIVGRCRRCRCRFTAWPGGPHYDAIAAARDEKEGKART